MDDGVDAIDKEGRCLGIEKIGADKLSALETVPGIPASGGANGVSLGKQRLDDRNAQPAGGAGDKHTAHRRNTMAPMLMPAEVPSRRACAPE